jgi:hypothetical protein
MRRVFGGAVLVVAGIAAFIEAHSHKPALAYAGSTRSGIVREVEAETPHAHLGLSQTNYDLLRIGGWALVIVGGSLVVGLIAYWTAQTRPSAHEGK